MNEDPEISAVSFLKTLFYILKHGHRSAFWIKQMMLNFPLERTLTPMMTDSSIHVSGWWSWVNQQQKLCWRRMGSVCVTEKQKANLRKPVKSCFLVLFLLFRGGGCWQLFRGARKGVSGGGGGRAKQQRAVGRRDNRCVSLQQLHDGPGVRWQASLQPETHTHAHTQTPEVQINEVLIISSSL